MLGMSEKGDRLQIVCQCCQATLTVDRKTGLVMHSQEKKTGYSFEDALQEVNKRKAMADKLFDKAFTDEQHRRSTLEEKFKQALESKDELDEPVRPWDVE